MMRAIYEYMHIPSTVRVWNDQNILAGDFLLPQNMPIHSLFAS